MTLLSLCKSRIPKKGQIFSLLLVIGLEVLLGAFLWERSKPGAILGFLIKDGNHYRLAWKDNSAGFETRTMGSIEEALQYAREELKLSAGVNPFTEHELEHVWLQDRFGTYLVMWKTIGINFLNQITFNRQSDALFFAKAFRQGSYSPSPFGHSILLTPKRAFP